MKNITDAVNPSLYQVSRESNRLKKLVSQCVPAELSAQLLFLRINEKKLHVTTSGSAWASRLRFSTREILAVLAQNGIQLHGLKVHVLPESKNIKVAARESQRLRPRAGTNTVNSIRQVAGSVDPGDDSLRDALKRLALESN